MNLSFHIYSLSLLLSGFISALMSYVIFLRVKGAGRSFVWILLTIAVWSMAYGAELSSSSLPVMLFFTQIQYIGIGLLPACWIVFVIKFIGKEQWLNRVNTGIIYSIPILTICMVWTNRWHHLHYLQSSLNVQGPFPSLSIQPGPWYWLHTVYFYIMLVMGAYLMLRTFSRANDVYRKQNLTILIGVLFPWVFNILYLLDIRPMHIDLTPYGFVITAAVISFGLLKFKLLHIVPIAREKIIEAMQEGVLVLDHDNKIVDYNAQLVKLLGRDLPELIGMDLADILPEQVQLQELIRKRANTSVQLEFYTSGSCRYFEVNSRILAEKNVSSNSLLLLFREITEQKIAQKEATSAYYLLSGVLDSSLSAVLAFRTVRGLDQGITDFECIACNQQAVSILGFSHNNGDYIGKRLLEILPFIKQVDVFQGYREVVETGKTFEKEITFINEQEQCWLHLVAVRLEDGFTVTFTDITARKKTEVMLEISKANLSALIENTSDLIWSVDTKYRFITVNSSFKYSYNLISGQELKEGDYISSIKLSSPQDVLWKRHLQRAFNGETFSVETVIKTRNGVQTFESSLNPIRSRQGTVEGITVYSRNITRRKEAEKEILLAREAAENANSFKTRFLANITHEIRTPINAIIGFSEILKNQQLTNEQKEYVQYILSAGDLLLKLIGDVLDLTKIEQGKMSIEKESFQFRQVLSSVIDPYKFRAEEKGLTFYVNYDQNLPSFLIGDSGKLCQIIVNLIGNALKFTGQGGISVSFTSELYSPEKQQTIPGESELTIHNPAGKATENTRIHLKITVSDTGIGIPQEQQNRVFQSFTQADASISRRFGGSGLGLSIIKDMVHLMGGQLGIISPATDIPAGTKGGPGSTFWISLPLEVDHHTAVVEEEALVQTGEINYMGKVKVLMAEDNLVNQRLAQLILQQAGCRVVMANNGEEALEQLAKQDFNIVFMDLQMPVMDGYTAVENIRLYNKLIPVVGLSANVYKEDIEQCYKVGMNDYLGKPYNAEKLINKLQSWIRLPDKASTADPVTNDHFELYLPTSHNLDMGVVQLEENMPVIEYPMDLSALNDITGGIVSEMKEMIEAIINVEKEFIEAMDQWLLQKANMPLSASAHKLKGCLFLVGLDHLRQDLQQIEIQSKDALMEEEVSSLCLKLKPVFVTCSKELQIHLSRLQ